MEGNGDHMTVLPLGMGVEVLLSNETIREIRTKWREINNHTNKIEIRHINPSFHHHQPHPSKKLHTQVHRIERILSLETMFTKQIEIEKKNNQQPT